MIFRVVRVTIAPGKYDAYWSWSRDVLELWDEGGIQRAGGPYDLVGPDGERVALWLTVHETEETARSEFQTLYAAGRGRELMQQRPALVSSSDSATYADWVPGKDVPPPAPAW